MREQMYLRPKGVGGKTYGPFDAIHHSDRVLLLVLYSDCGGDAVRAVDLGPTGDILWDGAHYFNWWIGVLPSPYSGAITPFEL